LRASRTGLMTEADQAKRQSTWICRLRNAVMCQSRKKIYYHPEA
jgi:hypothetical protein